MAVLPASSLIFYDDGDEASNTESIPSGAYANAGWQHQLVITRGTSTYLATIISPKHFMTAAHTGIGSGDDRVVVSQPDFFTGTGAKTFTVKNGTSPVRIQFSYTPPATPEEPDPEPELRNTDLFVFEIWETFDGYAGLYTEDDEVGQEVVICGYGDARGAIVKNSLDQDRGWGPDIANRKARWGTNRADGVAQSFTEITDQGLLLYCDFDATGPGKTPFECQGANKDSSGGWFIKDGAHWELAAVNFGVDTYGTTSGSTGNRWAIYDGVGLYHGSTSPLPITADSFYRRSHTYATRISEHVAAINAVIQPAKDTAVLPALGRFEVWAESYGLGTGVATDGDADKDGLTHLEEYLTESDPNESADAKLPLSVDLTMAGTHKFTVIESLDLAGRGLTTALEVSGDLVQWDPVVGTSEDSNLVDSIAGTRTRELSMSFVGTGAVYYRLKITL